MRAIPHRWNNDLRHTEYYADRSNKRPTALLLVILAKKLHRSEILTIRNQFDGTEKMVRIMDLLNFEEGDSSSRETSTSASVMVGDEGV